MHACCICMLLVRGCHSTQPYAQERQGYSAFAEFKAVPCRGPTKCWHLALHPSQEVGYNPGVSGVEGLVHVEHS